MSKQPRVAIDPDTLKPIIEAMIFASEEPLSARALLRLLAGDPEPGRSDDDPAPQPDAPEPAAPADDPEERGAGITLVEEDPDTENDSRETETAVEQTEPSREEQDVEESDDSSSMNSPVTGGTIEIAGEDVDELVEAMEHASRRRRADASQGLDQAYLRALVDELNDEYEESGRVFRIVEVAGGFQFATMREFGEFVAMLSKDKARRRLSPAALETLAIIAYRQPVSKPEVEAIRGVNCDQVLLSLMEKNLVAITGRSEAVGRPLLYGTTEDFLRIFGLKGLGDLPKLREIEELMEEDAYSAEKAEVITVDEDTDVEEIEAKVGAAGHHGEQSEDGLPHLSGADTAEGPEPEALGQEENAAVEESPAVTPEQEEPAEDDAMEEEEPEEGDEEPEESAADEIEDEDQEESSDDDPEDAGPGPEDADEPEEEETQDGISEDEISDEEEGDAGEPEDFGDDNGEVARDARMG